MFTPHQPGQGVRPAVVPFKFLQNLALRAKEATVQPFGKCDTFISVKDAFAGLKIVHALDEIVPRLGS